MFQINWKGTKLWSTVEPAREFANQVFAESGVVVAITEVKLTKQQALKAYRTLRHAQSYLFSAHSIFDRVSPVEWETIGDQQAYERLNSLTIDAQHRWGGRALRSHRCQDCAQYDKPQRAARGVHGGPSPEQARALLAKQLTGDFGNHTWGTVRSLITAGYIVENAQHDLEVTAKGKQYCDEHHLEISL